jgi:hypothetical protein
LCLQYELTSKHPAFDPHHVDLTSQEAAANDVVGREHPTGDQDPKARSLLSVERLPANFDLPYENAELYQSLLRTVQVASIQTKTQCSSITAEQLALNWGIGIEEAAHRTLKVTTQCGIWTMRHPSLTRCLPTNDCVLCYHRLPMDLFTDTMKATMVSRQGTKYAQEVYAAPNGWTHAYPMMLQSQAHETFSLLCARDGVPMTLIVDGAHEQTKGEFCRKCHQVGSHV